MTVAAVHVLLGYALIAGFGLAPVQITDNPLKVFAVREQSPPPPIIPEQPAAEEEAPQVESAPPAPTAQASPFVAPRPEVRIEAPPLLVAAPVAGLADDISLGAADVAGPGTGGGGEGSGTGAGGRGSGTGDGGTGTRTRRIRGSITSADYPRAAERAGAEGIVVARLTVGVNGRVRDCTIRKSSGNEALDATTCGIILERFRFEPARNAQGAPVTETVEWEQIWTLERESPEAAEAKCRAQTNGIRGRGERRAAFMKCMADLGWTRR